MARPRPTLIGELKRILPPDARLLLAVSGGQDSVAMLHATVSIRHLRRLHIEVAHLDHGLRSTSRSDAKFVKDLSCTLKVPCHSKRSRARPKKVNLEAWGRDQRYRFFDEIRLKQGLDFILTAHTANDVAETLLMRLVSNKELRSIERFDSARYLIRPMLYIQRKQVEEYIRIHRLSFKDDITNQDPRFLRNRVRNSLIPLLERGFNQRIVEILAARADALDKDYVLLETFARGVVALVEGKSFGSKDWVRTVKSSLVEQPLELRWRTVELLLKNKLGFRVGRAKSREFLELVMGRVSGVEFPQGVAMRRRKGGHILCSGLRSA